MTPAQVAMYADAESAEPEDDWSQFGCWREGDHITGPEEAVRRYTEWKQQQNAEASDE